MVLARLAACGKQQLDPQGPWRAPEQQGPEIGKKSYHAIRDGFPRLFDGLRFARFGHFGLGRPLALREIPGAGRKQKNTMGSILEL